MSIDPMRQEKWCNCCERELPIESFGLKKNTTDGHDGICIDCSRIETALKGLKRQGKYLDQIDRHDLAIRRLTYLKNGLSIREAAKIEAKDNKFR